MKIKNIATLLSLLLASNIFAATEKDRLERTKDGYVNMSSSPQTVNGADVNISGSLIMWRGNMVGMNASISNVYPGGSSAPQLGHVSRPKTKMKPGFKIGFGIILDHDDAELNGEFTRYTFSTDPTTIEMGEESNTLFSTYQIDPATSGNKTIFYSSSTWKAKVNKIDITLGRGSFLSDYMTLMPYFGLSSTFNKHDYDIDYKFIGSTTMTEFEYIRYTLKQNGIGLMIGSTGTYYFLKDKLGLALYCNSSLSGLWTKYRGTQDTTSKENASAGLVTRLNYNDNFHTVMPVFDINLGLQLDLLAKSKAYQGTFYVGWENQVWWTTNIFYGIHQIPSSIGQFNTTGLTARLRLDF